MSNKGPTIAQKLIVSAVILVTLTFIGLTSLVIFQLELTFKKQTDKFEVLAEKQFNRVMRSDLQHLSTSITKEMDDIANRVASIARQPSFLEAMHNENYTVISKELQQYNNTMGMDGLILFNVNSKILGSSNPELEPNVLRGYLEQQGFTSLLKGILRQRLKPNALEFYGIIPAKELGSIIGKEIMGSAAEVTIAPIFNDNGQLDAILVAQKWMRYHDRILESFKSITNINIIVFYRGEVVSTTVDDLDQASISDINEFSYGDLKKLKGNYVLCDSGPRDLRICAVNSAVIFQEVIAIISSLGEEAKIYTLTRIVGFAVFCIIVVIFVALAISVNITSPLKEITKALSAVTERNYNGEIQGGERSDEVGDIARAAVLMQKSVKEREDLRVNIEKQQEKLLVQEKELRVQNTQFEAAINSMIQGLCLFDANRNLIRTNNRFISMFSLRASSVFPGKSWESLFKIMLSTTDKDVMTGDESGSEFLSINNIVHVFSLNSGRSIEMSVSPVHGGGWVCTFEDITDRKRVSDHLSYLATHDALTQLPNRLLMQRHLSEKLAHLRRTKQTFGILWMDLDQFKTVNDSLGHATGDKLLCHVGKVLRENLRENEMVVRLGGDEFAVITAENATHKSLEQQAKRIIALLSRPCYLDGHEITVGVSIGILLVMDETVPVDQLLKQADLALYQAKEEGRNTYCFFQERLAKRIQMQQRFSSELRWALERDEFILHYQPQVDLSTSKLIGFEALVRWQHPKHGLLSPAHFISIAEETGLMQEIGRVVLEKACHEAARWPLELKVAVNLSPKQVEDGSLVKDLRQLLLETGLASHQLELEITETTVLSNDDHVIEVIKSLREMGVSIAMDDFGTGYSSLSFLRRYTFDTMKIDRSFVAAISSSKDNRNIVEAIVKLSQMLGLKVIAEGVESEKQARILKKMNCEYAQGFYFAKPLAPEFIPDMIGQKLPLAN
ncbi:EAL domain-containing protein [Polycladidibacter stylochi]|uniref:EAL domain-containing protein n=1 Tax=Polycladidibacter stylochi TaxID=1807766 RepID=UPI00082F9FC4|nr:EAL domain-containing protein [Pseudovibrio stylochi]